MTQYTPKEVKLKVPGDVYRQLEALARDDDRSVASTIRIALRRWCAEEWPRRTPMASEEFMRRMEAPKSVTKVIEPKKTMTQEEHEALIAEWTDDDD